jgi:dihydrofolate reductase
LSSETKTEEDDVGAIKVHEFMTMDGVIEAPTFTMESGFDPKMGEAIAGAMAGWDGILLGRTTFEMFEPAWSVRTAQEDPGVPFFNDTMKYVVSSTLRDTTWRNSEVFSRYDAAAILKNLN